jgi:hypothetical protein
MDAASMVLATLFLGAGEQLRTMRAVAEYSRQWQHDQRQGQGERDDHAMSRQCRRINSNIDSNLWAARS